MTLQFWKAGTVLSGRWLDEAIETIRSLTAVRGIQVQKKRVPIFEHCDDV